MKKSIYLLILIIPIMSCASTEDQQLTRQASAGSSTAQTSTGGSTADIVNGINDFSDVIGKDLKLTSVFISGMAAPNRYTAPYSLGENHAITIGQMATTMMASFIEPENLKEREFTAYMQNAYAWAEENNQFVLLSKTADNCEVRLNFSL